MEFFLVWVFSMIIGCLIGSSKDRLGSGLIWSFLFGPLGVLVVICLPNLRRQREEERRKLELDHRFQLQMAQLQKIEQANRATVYPVPPLPPTGEPRIRIASGGEDLGELPVSSIKLLLKTGKLSRSDYYFDKDANDWMEIDCCPELI